MTVMGSPLRCSDLKVPRVTFFRWVVGGDPMGEWELDRICTAPPMATGRGPRVHAGRDRSRGSREEARLEMGLMTEDIEGEEL